MTDRLPQPNYEKIPNRKNLSFQNNSLPEVKVPPGSKKKKESRNEPKRDGSLDLNHEKPVERDSSPRARNVISLQPNRNEEIEMLKKKLRVEKASDENNIRVVKHSDLDTSNPHDGRSKEKDEKGKDFLLPNINGNGNNDTKQDNSPRRR